MKPRTGNLAPVLYGGCWAAMWRDCEFHGRLNGGRLLLMFSVRQPAAGRLFMKSVCWSGRCCVRMNSCCGGSGEWTGRCRDEYPARVCYEANRCRSIVGCDSGMVMGTEKRRVRVGKVLKAEMESADIGKGRVTGRSLCLPEIQIGFYSAILVQKHYLCSFQ